jgi:hypothetical protein
MTFFTLTFKFKFYFSSLYLSNEAVLRLKFKDELYGHGSKLILNQYVSLKFKANFSGYVWRKDINSKL